MKKKETIDKAKLVSLIGQKEFKRMVDKEILSGIDPNEAPDLIARRKLKGII